MGVYRTLAWTDCLMPGTFVDLLCNSPGSPYSVDQFLWVCSVSRPFLCLMFLCHNLTVLCPPSHCVRPLPCISGQQTVSLFLVMFYICTTQSLSYAWSYFVCQAALFVLYPPSRYSGCIQPILCSYLGSFAVSFCPMTAVISCLIGHTSLQTNCTFLAAMANHKPQHSHSLWHVCPEPRSQCTQDPCAGEWGITPASGFANSLCRAWL